MKTQNIFIVSFFASAIVLLAQEPTPPAPAASTAASAPEQSEMQKWIATTDAPWQAAFKRDITDWNEAELNKVKIQYITALEEGIKKASASNDLKAALALRGEQKRFGDTQVFSGEG